MKWNPISNNQNLPKKTGTYLVTVTSSSAKCVDSVTRKNYSSHSRVTMAWFRITKSGYRWTWDDEVGGTDTLYDACENSWVYEGTEYHEAIVAWADMPKPYKES